MTTVDIREHGAVGDGDGADPTDNAGAVQAAIDAVAAAGGGTVVVPALPGGAVFLAGSIELRSHVELHLERGAVLRASHRWQDHTARFEVGGPSTGTVREGDDPASAFITCRDVEDVAITGAGTIDGNGRAFVTEDLGPIYAMPDARAFTLFLIGAKRLTLTDTVYRDGALWTIRLTGCEDVTIHAIHVEGDLRLPNNDGIDLDRCRRVRISDCSIVCGDDAISLKTCEEFARYGPCEDVTVTGCTITTTSSALVVGVDATDDIRDVVFDSCVITASNRGLSVNCGQEGRFENISFSNMVVSTRLFDDRWWGRGEPIYVSAAPWHRGREPGGVANVRFRNVLARSENGAYIAGTTPGAIRGVVLEGVRIELGSWSGHQGGRYDQRPYDEGDDFVEAPTSGFHLERATDVTVRGCEVAWAQDQPSSWFAHALLARDVDGLVVEDLRGDGARTGVEAVVVEGGSQRVPRRWWVPGR